MTRNMFRKQKQAFDYDHISFAISKEIVDSEDWKDIKYVDKQFFMLPFEHSENLDHQVKSMELFEKYLGMPI